MLPLREDVRRRYWSGIPKDEVLERSGAYRGPLGVRSAEDPLPLS